MSDLENVRKRLEENRKEKEALELEMAMMEAEPNRKMDLCQYLGHKKFNFLCPRY